MEPQWYENRVIWLLDFKEMVYSLKKTTIKSKRKFQKSEQI